MRSKMQNFNKIKSEYLQAKKIRAGSAIVKKYKLIQQRSGSAQKNAQ